MIRRVLIAVVVSLASLPVAHAEDVIAYQAEGAAPAASPDARVMALDEAFARATASALADLVAGDVRTARKGELDREIVARARLWVAKFAVTKDETVDGRRELTVSVKIDRDKLRARLGELKIATKDLPASNPEPAASQRTATILLRIVQPRGVRAVYGPNADKELPGMPALTALLRNAGFAVRRAPASGPPPRADGELPLSDDEADVLARDAQAEVMAIAGVNVGPGVAVRGQPGLATLVTAHVRVVDRSGRKLIGQGSASAAARGDDPGYAIDRALDAAAVDVLPPPAQKLGPAGAFRGDDTPIGEPGIVLVRLSARTPYASVLEAQRYLAGAKGVRSATLRRLSPTGWIVGVATSESIEQVARIAKKWPIASATAQVKIVGDIVDVSLSGAP